MAQITLTYSGLPFTSAAQDAAAPQGGALIALPAIGQAGFDYSSVPAGNGLKIVSSQITGSWSGSADAPTGAGLPALDVQKYNGTVPNGTTASAAGILPHGFYPFPNVYGALDAAAVPSTTPLTVCPDAPVTLAVKLPSGTPFVPMSVTVTAWTITFDLVPGGCPSWTPPSPGGGTGGDPGNGGTGGNTLTYTVLPNSCVVTLTRPYFRDAVRRKMGTPPPIDTGFGGPGEEPPGMGYPSNNDINQALDNAIGQINRVSGFHSSQQIVIPVTAAASPGAQAFSLMGCAASSTQAVINDVRRVVWDDGRSPVVKLNATTFYALDRANVPFDAYTPSTPRDYYVEGYSLFLTPAADRAGSLRLYCGTGVSTFCADTDMLDELPNDYLQVVENIAVYLLRIARPSEPNAKEQIPLYAGLTKAGLSEVRIWANTINQTVQNGIIYASNRRSRR